MPSRGSLAVLGISAALIGFCFLLVGAGAGSALPVGPWPFYGLAAFCGVVAAACLAPRSRKVTVRIVGAVILAACLLYLLGELRAPAAGAKRNPVMAGIALVVFGLPAGWVAVTGKYPWWGAHANPFYRNSRDDYR